MTATAIRDTSIGDFSSWGFQEWDFDDFHQRELPRRLEDGGNSQIAWDVKDAPPFAAVLPDGRAYSYIVEGEAIRIAAGIHPEARCVIELNERAWQNYVHELRTPSALVLSESVRFLRGGMNEWDVWLPAIQCMYSGREIFDPSQPLLDAQGKALDLHRKFTLGDDHEEMSHFLRTAGFLIVKGAMLHRRQELADEIDRVRDASQEGEIYSWWTDNLTTGERFPYRLMFLSERSEKIRSLMEDDPTIAALVKLAKHDLVPLHDRGQGAMSVLKPFGEGTKLAPSIAGNLGWHSDCGLGGCNIMCPSINIGIHLDAAGPQSSQLWAMAGSNGRTVHHRTAMGSDCASAIALDTDPGDITIHYSCSMHAGPPPVGPNQRRTLYLPFYGPETLRLLGPYQSFEQILPGFGTGKIPSLSEVAQKQGAHA